MPTSDVTELLTRVRRGDGGAAETLMPLVYDELRRLAQHRLRGEAPDLTLQATALVNEAYLRLVEQRHAAIEDRRHFFAVAAQAMRRVLIDHIRRRRRLKRGGGRRVALDEIGEIAAIASPSSPGTIDVLAVDEALTALAAEHPQHARLVELRFFGGLSADDAAAVMGVTTRTAERWWQYAKARLFLALGEAPAKASDV